MDARALLLWALCAASVPALPARAATEEAAVDYLELAAVLTRDGAWERAAAALARVDPAAPATDARRYHSVRGMLALGQQDLARAAEACAAAIAASEVAAEADAAVAVDPQLHIQHAQALFGLERWQDALAALDAAGDAVAGLSGAWLMRAHAHWQLGNQEQGQHEQGQQQRALEVLADAAARFPANAEFARRQVFYLIELGLFQEAGALGLLQLQRSVGNAADHVVIGTALRRARSYDAALGVLEPAQLQFPDDGLVARALAQTWLERGDPLAAAEILARQTEREPVLLPEAAELFRRAGRRVRALALNARIAEQPRKLQQRVGLLVELGRFAEVAGMEEALYRNGLLEDEDIRYALAYARFQLGDHAAAERHLKALTRPELFRRATEMRRLMQDCAGAQWACG